MFKTPKDINLNERILEWDQQKLETIRSPNGFLETTPLFFQMWRTWDGDFWD